MSDFLSDIKIFTRALKDASKWQNSRRSIAYVKDGSSDYIYEFYCYIRMLSDLNTNYDLKFKTGRVYRAKFPEKPGLKQNFPRFEIFEKNSGKKLYQLCAGTMIESDFPDQNLHPDISLQTALAPESPNKSHVLLIWDAKYVNKKKRVPNKEIRDFSAIVDIYELRGKRAPKIYFKSLKILLGNCLITNGDSHHESGSDAFLKKRGIKLVYHFDVSGIEKGLG
jgi:hypothetical protein